nr:hypothetical protein [Tanacetum cinerariifolium]
SRVNIRCERVENKFKRSGVVDRLLDVVAKVLGVTKEGYGVAMQGVEGVLWLGFTRLGDSRDHLSACLTYMLYCIVFEEQYNLAYFFTKRIKCARSNPTANLPCVMFLTYLYRHIIEHYPHLDNGIYSVVDRVMRLLALKQTRKLQSDRGKARHSVLSTSAHNNHGSSSRQGDDGDSRVSIPSPITFLNSLKPLDHQQYDIPTSSKQDDDLLFENFLEAHGDSCLCCIHNRTLIFELRDELQYMFSYIKHMLSQPPIPNTPPPSLSPN